ncbi:hypothetical protein KY284_003258 [Solanum tuberosum]|nr:hypothetical protein KY284_003258 [Solanum tuberosum]
MAAIAGGLVVILGGDEGVEGIVQSFLSGFPQRSVFPAKNSVFWFDKAIDSGISPVRLLKERSIAAFAGIFFANSGDTKPDNLFEEKFKYFKLSPSKLSGNAPFNKLEERSNTSTN